MANKYSLLALIAILIIAAIIFSHPQKHQRQIKAIPVITTLAAAKPMPIEINLPGIVTPIQTVAVKSQVSGLLKKIYFEPGQEVAQGELLFAIEAAPFYAQLQQAEATLARGRAQLDNLRKDVRRYQELIKKNYMSKQAYNQAQANLEAQEALVRSDAQMVKQAKINLNYTKITAAIAGKTGDVAFKLGNLISAESNTPLVTINQINPIEVDFNLAQKYLKRTRRYNNKGTIEIEVWRENGTKLLGNGKLTFIDNQVNNLTGTVLLKAKIDNSKHRLWPGQMVAVKLILTIEPDALVIPTGAIQSDQKGTFVFIAHESNAVLRRIVVDRQMGGSSVIKSGLSAGEKIISIVPPELNNGDLIQPTVVNKTS